MRGGRFKEWWWSAVVDRIHGRNWKGTGARYCKGRGKLAKRVGFCPVFNGEP